MKRREFVAGASVATAFAASADLAFAQSGGTLGVLLLHGKQSRPGTPGLNDISSKLSGIGARVFVPSMPWEGQGWERISVTVEQVHTMIDGYVAQLRGQGAQRIVVGGQSLGANVALSYAVARQNVAACVMLAPGHSPGYVFRTYSDVPGLIEKAVAMVNSGQGAQPFRGTDDNQGSKLSLSTTAAAYLSWMSPRRAAAMNVQAPLLPASIPLLMVMGRQDPAFNYNEANIYKPAAKNPYSKYIVVNAGHRDTDFAASAQVVSWIGGLPA
ncbi:alpha/beta fold hydrolase [Reyranella sp.]|uniref:alpha/beta fold hydrolase n=1 Tax=Reyranella sp. TaxID=1929291 RepID=UPI00273061BF|nr:alpha/beta hydrolase [Reyranella sp.]MDP2378591.1 alpha/beta hydrolase [Reyranella sp.]